MFASETSNCVAAGKLMHKQGLSDQTVEPDFRLGISLQLIALAVHLLEDKEEQVHFVLVPCLHHAKLFTTLTMQHQLHQHIHCFEHTKALPATWASCWEQHSSVSCQHTRQGRTRPVLEGFCL